MLLGILADIHDAVGPLDKALAFLWERRADRFVTLGDAFETFEPGEAGAEVARRLLDAGAVGVWGNHDFGLSHDVIPELRERADPGLLAFASQLRAELVVEGCRFCHIEPWRDARKVEDLWRFDGAPDTAERARRSFRAVPEKSIFIGHFHSLLVVRNDGPLRWDGLEPLRLDRRRRHLVVAPAVRNGWCLMFETSTSLLTAIRCADVEIASFAPESAYRADVARAFEEIAGDIRCALPATRIDHVGSTAVPGSLTKGDLDLCVAVGAEDFPAADRLLAARMARNEGSDRSDTFSAFCTVAGNGVPVGVQLVVAGSAADDFVRWRDRLRASADLRSEYDALKRAFDGRPMDEYREAKGAFIEEALRNP